MRLSEDEIRRLTLSAIEELGEKASPELVKRVLQKSIEKSDKSASNDAGQGRVILTSFGLNTPGIVSAITKAISEANCDIHDISQKIMAEFFTMIMIIDITNSPKDFREIQDEMNKIAEKLNIKIYLQHEDIFRFMHRI